MCLPYNHENTENFKKKKVKSIMCYKLLEKRKQKNKFILVSPIYYTKRWLPGECRSNRRSKSVSNSEIRYGVDKGIHVYLTKRAAENNKSSWEVLVKVTCYLKDFIACSNSDYNEAVFTKVYLSKEEYDKAVK